MTITQTSEPSLKRRRSAEDSCDNIPTDGFSSSSEQNPTDSTIPSTNVTFDTSKDVNVNNKRTENFNDSRIDENCSENCFTSNEDDHVIQPTSNSEDLSDKNYVNYKKNGIFKDKNVTPIELAIKNNEKGALHTLLIQNFDNNGFLWSNTGKKSIRINPFTQQLKDKLIQ